MDGKTVALFNPIGEPDVSASNNDGFMCAVRAIGYGIRVSYFDREFTPDNIAAGLQQASMQLGYTEFSYFSHETILLWAAQQQIPTIIVHSRNNGQLLEISAVGIDDLPTDRILGIWLHNSHWYTIVPPHHKPKVSGEFLSVRCPVFTPESNTDTGFNDVFRMIYSRFGLEWSSNQMLGAALETDGDDAVNRDSSCKAVENRLGCTQRIEDEEEGPLSQGFESSQQINALAQNICERKMSKQPKAKPTQPMSPRRILSHSIKQDWPFLKQRDNLFKRSRGLFAWKPNARLGKDVVFHKGTIICDYAGVVMKTSDYNQMMDKLEAERNENEVAQIKAYACGDRNFTIVAHDESIEIVRNARGRMINHSIHSNVEAPAKKSIGSKNLFLMRAARTIYQGEELTFNYGRLYDYGILSFQNDCFNPCCFMTTIKKYAEEYQTYKNRRHSALECFEDEKYQLALINSLQKDLIMLKTDDKSDTGSLK
jgi:hypothetical protein